MVRGLARRPARSSNTGPMVALRVWTLAAVVASVYAVTHHDDFLDLRLLVPILVAVGFLFSFWRRGRRNWWVKVILALLCLEVGRQFLLGVLADPYHTSVPLTVLLLWLQTLHAFDVPARRDLLFSLLSSVILMAVAAAFAVNLSFLVYLAVYAFAVTQALVHNAWEGAQELAARRPGGPPAHSLPRPNPGGRGGAGEFATAAAQHGSLLWAANHLLALVVVGAAVAFVLTPRFEGLRLTTLPFSPQRTLLDLFAGRIVNPAYPDRGAGDADAAPPPWNPAGYFGFSATVDLRLRGRLDDTLVMRVRATRAFNWRALAFDTYTGYGWKASDPRVVQVGSASPPIPISRRADDGAFGHDGERVTQSFYIDVEQPNVIFAARQIEALYVPTGRVYLDRYGAIRLPGTLKPGTVYSVISRSRVPDPVRLRAATGPTPAFIRERYLALPPLPDRVHALAARLAAGAPTPYDRVEAVLRYLHAAYRYDLSIPPQRQRGDAVDYFLFEERRGYCEQFASALAVLLRSAGVPSRLVTGYGPGTLNPLTGLLEVRNSDAHAWVEVWFPSEGWVEFEPTPGFAAMTDLGRPPMARWVWQDLAALVAQWARAVAGRSPAAAGLIAAGAEALRAVGLVAALAVVAGGLSLGGRYLKVARPAGGGGNPFAAVYEEMGALLARRGWRRRPDETPAEYHQRVAQAGPIPEVALVTRISEAAAYGGERSAAALDEARRALEGLRRRIRAVPPAAVRAPFGQRVGRPSPRAGRPREG